MALEAADTPADNEEEEDEMDKKAKNAASVDKSKRRVKYVSLSALLRLTMMISTIGFNLVTCSKVSILRH